jgi:hypothetical protein
MCRPVTCNVCGKTTWAGCGQHVAQVKAMVPAAQWCGGKHSEAELAAAKPKGLFSIFGR